MSNFIQDKEFISLLEALDQSDIEKLGYKSLSIINESKQHQLWKPRMLLKNEHGDEIIINGEKSIIEKLKEIYNKTREL